MLWYNVFHKSFLYLSPRFQLRCVLVFEEKIVGQAIILHTALTFTYLVLVGRKRTPTTVRKDPGGVAILSWAGWVICKDTLKLEPCCVVCPAPSMVELIK